MIYRSVSVILCKQKAFYLFISISFKTNADVFHPSNDVIVIYKMVSPATQDTQ